MSTREAAMKPGMSPASRSKLSLITFSVAMCARSPSLKVPGAVSDDQFLLERRQRVARHRQVGFRSIQHHVDEERVVRGQWSDELILLAEGDEDVLDVLVQI